MDEIDCVLPVDAVDLGGEEGVLDNGSLLSVSVPSALSPSSPLEAGTSLTFVFVAEDGFW